MRLRVLKRIGLMCYYVNNYEPCAFVLVETEWNLNEFDMTEGSLPI